MVAMMGGHLESARLLVQADPATIFQTDRNQALPLHYAAYFGHLGCAQFLLVNGSKHSPDMTGCRPLHYALHRRQYETAMALHHWSPSATEERRPTASVPPRAPPH